MSDVNALLHNLLGNDLKITPEVIQMFQNASPAGYGAINGRFFTPYATRLDMGESTPVGSLGQQRSLQNYINEVNKALSGYSG